MQWMEGKLRGVELRCLDFDVGPGTYLAASEPWVLICNKVTTVINKCKELLQRLNMRPRAQLNQEELLLLVHVSFLDRTA